MWKTLRRSRLLIGLALFGAISPPAWSGGFPAQADTPERYAAIVINAETGEVLFARHADDARYPASITKVMTLYMLFDAMAQGHVRPTDRIQMTARGASQPPSKLGLAAGQTLSVDEAIQALAVRSANDVAVAVAEHLSGSVEAFAIASTEKGRTLGLSRTRFVNPHGLPDSRHVSSAHDLVRLSHAVMRDFPQYYGYFGQREWGFEGRVLRNTNGLLHADPSIDGLKTGFTRASGYNLAATSTQDGRRLITVVLGGRTSQSRNAHVADLMRTGFEAERIRASGTLDGDSQAFFEARGYGLDDASADGPVPYLSTR
ncbi:MAG: D-alanyl-D-alanine carboxypeptidase family protein [Brevundimonas sp.]|uniref:D-alanyl-D-alanine carboxypeptidase family protein n=1 Tax=Brevundimonas sp. TaxID=1871086 RepID=UPI00391DBAD1